MMGAVTADTLGVTECVHELTCAYEFIIFVFTTSFGKCVTNLIFILHTYLCCSTAFAQTTTEVPLFIILSCPWFDTLINIIPWLVS